MAPAGIRAIPKAVSPIIRRAHPRAPTGTATATPATARSFTYRPNYPRHSTPPSSTPLCAPPKRSQSNAAFERPPSANIESISQKKQPPDDPIVKVTTTSTSSPPPSTPSPAATSHDLTSPLHLPTWLSKNSHLLKPPIGNHCVTNSSMTIMIVGGPNARTDYHINSTPEFFYQHKGDMVLKTVETEPAASTDAGFENTEPSMSAAGDGGNTSDRANTRNSSASKEVFRDIRITEGSLYLLPPNVPHSPQRFADTVGLVVELPRPQGARDTLRWYCQDCGGRVYEESFECVDLGTQIKKAVQGFEGDLERRKCGGCGAIADVRPK